MGLFTQPQQVEGLDGTRPNNFLVQNVNFANNGWKETGKHKLFNINGAVRVRLFVVIPQNLTSGTSLATVQCGVSPNTALFMPATGVTQLSQGKAWLDNTPSTQYPYGKIIDFVFAAGGAIGYEVAVEATTGGQISFACWSEPLDPMGNVTLGDGTAF